MGQGDIFVIINMSCYICIKAFVQVETAVQKIKQKDIRFSKVDPEGLGFFSAYLGIDPGGYD